MNIKNHDAMRTLLPHSVDFLEAYIYSVSVLPKVRLNAPKFAGLNLPIPFPESVANEYCAFDKNLLDKNPLKKEPVW